MADRTKEILKTVAEYILEEDGFFYIIVNADKIDDLPLNGVQRLVLGGKATTHVSLKKEGVSAGLSINRVHYDVVIPWDTVSGVEGSKGAFYCKRNEQIKEENAGAGKDEKRHLKLVTD